MKSTHFLLIILFAGVVAVKAQVFENAAINDHTFEASSFINDNEGWLADNNGMIWHTVNACEAWDSVVTGKNFLKLCFTDALHGFALTSDGAYKSTDGGHTWIAVTLPGKIGKAICFLNGDTGFISGHYGVYKTTDGGTTWNTITTDAVSYLDYYFVSGSAGIAAAYDGSTYKSIWRTADGGITWNSVFSEINYFITSVWFVNESKGWAAGYFDQIGVGHEPVILQTADGGLTWQHHYLNTDIGGRGETFLDIRFRNELEGVAVSGYSESVFTTDGGVSWSRIYDNVTSGISVLNGMYRTLGGQNHLYLAGMYGNVGMWK